MDPIAEEVLFKNRRPDRPATLDEYRQSGGYEALIEVVKERTPDEVRQLVTDSGLRGRGGAGYPTGRKWGFITADAGFPRYVVPNTDEMEPGTYKDRVLIHADPHMLIEGIVITAWAVRAEKAVIFIRPEYENAARILEREIHIAEAAGYLGRGILGSDFGLEIVVHRSAGRYISGEATAMVQAIMGQRPHPQKNVHMTDAGLWDRPTIVNNAETLACVPLVIRNGGAWFKSLARTETGAGTKLYCISGKVVKPGCYELPMGIPFREILEEVAGGMLPGSELKAFIPGGASTSFMPPKFLDVAMNIDSLKQVGHRFGTGAIIVFDRKTCIMGATLNLINYFARESCGFCTPCRQGLPYIQDLLQRLENGEGEEDFIPMIREMAGHMDKAYCAFAPGAAEPVKGMLRYFEDEVREHIRQKKCPFK